MCFIISFVTIFISKAYAECGIPYDGKSAKCYFTKIEKDNILPIANSYLNIREDSIYFIETSCNGKLDFKQVCSIESAAKAHPNRTINVLFLNRVNKECLFKWPVKNIMNVYSNVNLFRLNISDFFNNTPLFRFLRRKVFLKSHYPVTHMSDLLRFATLYKYGGIYLDLDVVVAKSFDTLFEIFLGKEDDNQVGSAVLSLSRSELGTTIATTVMRLQRQTFKPHDWGYNAIGILKIIVKRICDKTKWIGSADSYCGSVAIYGPEKFFPIKYKSRRKYYKTPNTINEVDLGNNFAYHVWNAKRPSGNHVYKNSFYGKLIENYCPVLYGSMDQVADHYVHAAVTQKVITQCGQTLIFSYNLRGEYEI